MNLAKHAATVLPLLLFSVVALAGTPRPNMLLISVDTLRADRLSTYGGSAKTPGFDALASRSVVFEQAIAQAPLTLPSHTTIFTGLFPDQHGIRNNENFVLPDAVTSVTEVFRQNGYATGAVVGSFSLDSSFGLSQGFQYYEDKMGKGDDPSANRYVERRAATVWKLGRDWISRQSSPWFCFLHFFDPHTAYNPPAPFPASYDGEIAYVDGVLQEIWDHLKTSGALTNTVVVLLSDHGESLGEHGEASHGVFLYDATLRVPLMISVPGRKPARISEQVRLADIAPTLTELAGISGGATFRPSGQSLVAAMNGSPVNLPAYSESFYTNLLMGWAPLQSVRWNGRKWIQAPRQEFYDLQKDPQELKNVYSPSSIPVTMKREIAKHSGKPQHAPLVENADPEVQEKLASLGYVTGGSSAPQQSGYDPKDGIHLWAKIEAAVTAAQSGNLADSTILLEDVVRQQPENVIARKFLANVLRKKGELKAAEENLRAALDSPLHRNETRYDLAQVLSEQQQDTEALRLLDLVVREEPSNLRACKLAALVAVKAQQYAAAVPYLQRAHALRAGDPDTLSMQGRVYSYLGKDSDALQSFTALEQLRSLNEEEALQVAALYLTRREPANAEKYFRAAVQANASSAAGWKGLGLIFASGGKWGDALDAFLKARECQLARDMLSKLGSPRSEQIDAVKKLCP